MRTVETAMRNVIIAVGVTHTVHRGTFELMPWPACREGVPTNRWLHTNLPVTCRRCLAAKS